MATADEEAGGFFGAGWLVKEKPEIFEGVGYLLNEGGSTRSFGDQRAVLVEDSAGSRDDLKNQIN